MKYKYFFLSVFWVLILQVATKLLSHEYLSRLDLIT